ncbi:MAG: SDR family NAD(P)-dependent oxidoreductase [Bryobacteraceae bacterium]
MPAQLYLPWELDFSRRTVQKIRAAAGKAEWAIAELAQPSAPGLLFEQAVSPFGTVDILVNNAGVIRRKPAIRCEE